MRRSRAQAHSTTARSWAALPVSRRSLVGWRILPKPQRASPSLLLPRRLSRRPYVVLSVRSSGASRAGTIPEPGVLVSAAAPAADLRDLQAGVVGPASRRVVGSCRARSVFTLIRSRRLAGGEVRVGGYLGRRGAARLVSSAPVDDARLLAVCPSSRPADAGGCTSSPLHHRFPDRFWLSGLADRDVPGGRSSLWQKSTIVARPDRSSFGTLDSHGDGQKTGGATGVADVGGHGGPSDE